MRAASGRRFPISGAYPPSDNSRGRVSSYFCEARTRRSEAEPGFGVPEAPGQLFIAYQTFLVTRPRPRSDAFVHP